MSMISNKRMLIIQVHANACASDLFESICKSFIETSGVKD